jgi:hypothetical protein
MPKFKDTTQIQRADLNTGAAAGFETFASTLRSFSSTATQYAAPKILSQQQMAGGQAFEKGETPEFKAEGFIGGKTAAAFNKGLRSAYVASIDNDNRETLARFENENPDDLASFNKLSGEYAGSTLQHIDPVSRPIIEASINNMISSGRTRVQGREIARINGEAEDQRSLELKGASDAANLESFNGQPENAAVSLLVALGAIEAKVEAGDITPAEGQLLRRDTERKTAEEFMRGNLMREADSDSIEGAFSRLDEMSKKPEKGFTTQEWDTFIGSVQADLIQKQSRAMHAKADLTIDQTRDISNLKIRAATGTGSAGQIIQETEEKFNAGMISGGERTSIITATMNGQRRSQKKAMDFDAAAKKWGGDASQVLDNKVVDEFYSVKVAPAFEGMPPEMVEAEKANYVDRFKRVPAALKAEIANGLQSNDVDLIAQSAGLMDRLDEVPGLVDRSFSAADQAFASQVVSLSQNMEPQEAVKLARQITDPANSARVEAAESRIKAELKSDPEMYRGTVDDHFDPFFGSTKVDEVSGWTLAREYKSQYESFVKAGMSEGSAKEKALNIIGRNWSVSEVTGKVMKYAPDQYYQVNGSVDYIKPQLIADIKENFVGAEFSDAVLIGGKHTSRTAATGQPEYSIMLVTDEGLIPLQAGSWKPDMQKEIDRVTTENKAMIDSVESGQFDTTNMVTDSMGAGPII